MSLAWSKQRRNNFAEYKYVGGDEGDGIAFEVDADE